MKKYLIVLAAAVVALAGCKPSEKEGSKYTSLKFKEASIEMSLGETKKLVVLYEPTTLEPPVCEWSSSDSTIVSVDNGNIEALAYGEATITAKNGDLAAVCQVTVKDPKDMIQWGGWSLWGLDKETILSKDTVKRTLRSGQEVSCLMIPATYTIWSDGIYMDNEGSLHGEGYLIDLEGTALLITDDLGKGPNYHYLGVSTLNIIDAKNFNWQDTAYANCALAGALGTAEAHMAWLMDSTETVEPAFTGRIYAVDIDNNKYLDYFSGIIGTGIFVGDETEALYKTNIFWFEEPQLWGLVALEDYSNFVEPLQWAPLQQKYYEYLGEEEAPKYTVKEFVAPKDIKIARSTDKLYKK